MRSSSPLRGWLWFLLLAGFLLVAMLVARSWQQARSPLELTAAKPVWTIQLTGTTGDVATVWVWTPRASALTNVVLPAELRINQSYVLVQSTNRSGNPVKLAITHPQNGAFNLGWPATATNAATFVSTLGRLPFVGGYGGTGAPFGSRPVFEKLWPPWPERYEPAPEFPAALPVALRP